MQHSASAGNISPVLGAVTHAEILQQPSLWPTTLQRVQNSFPSESMNLKPVVITGAGTSAYAAGAIAASWRGAVAVPTTDLLVDPAPFFSDGGLLVSLARSGDSPESMAVLEKVRREFPKVEHVAITCNAEGKLAQAEEVQAIVLDPRTNDRSLAMTSSFSNLVLAGLCLHHAEQLSGVLPQLCRQVESLLPKFEQLAEQIADRSVSRVVVLASTPLFSMAREISLKILEMTAGKIVAIPETFLGLRHGPMSFLAEDTLVLSVLSSDPKIRRYEEDLLIELRNKKLGYLVSVIHENPARIISDEQVPACAADLPDFLRTPFEIVFPQLLAYHLSLRAGLNPDNPSPQGIITRVVQGFQIHKD